MKERITNVLSDVTKTGRKIKTSAYKKTGTYPIIDQSQDFVSGYTNDQIGLVTDVPYIIFGDHTCCVKFINFPLFLGADGGVRTFYWTVFSYSSKYSFELLLPSLVLIRLSRNQTRYFSNCGMNSSVLTDAQSFG